MGKIWTCVLLSVLLVGCDNVYRKRGEIVDATIVGVDNLKNSSSYTYLECSHGHRDICLGVWGKVGDSIKVLCENGSIQVRFSYNEAINKR